MPFRSLEVLGFLLPLGAPRPFLLPSPRMPFPDTLVIAVNFPSSLQFPVGEAVCAPLPSAGAHTQHLAFDFLTLTTLLPNCYHCVIIHEMRLSC